MVLIIKSMLFTSYVFSIFNDHTDHTNYQLVYQYTDLTAP